MHAAILFLLPFAAAPATDVPRGGDILLDNRCETAEWAQARRLDAGGGVTLALQHDEHYLRFCATPPAGSFATIDVYLQAGEGAPWNLHASAQLGEKQRGADGWPEDWQWGNQRGWYSPAVPFRGVARGDDGVRAQFGPVEGREMQISRKRFPGAAWRWMFELRALGPQQAESVVYPAGATPDDAASWAELRFE